MPHFTAQILVDCDKLDWCVRLERRLELPFPPTVGLELALYVDPEHVADVETVERLRWDDSEKRLYAYLRTMYAHALDHAQAAVAFMLKNGWVVTLGCSGHDSVQGLFAAHPRSPDVIHQIGKQFFANLDEADLWALHQQGEKPTLVHPR